MQANSKLLAVLPEGYGYVLLVGIESFIVNGWMARNVMLARKKHGIEYPMLYSPDNNEFNCVQRAHQQTLENHPAFLFFLLVGGLQYPKISAAAGCVYTLGRIFYAKGYYSGDPKNRKWGSFGMAGLVCLLGNTVSLAAHQLHWCGSKPCCSGC